MPLEYVHWGEMVRHITCIDSFMCCNVPGTIVATPFCMKLIVLNTFSIDGGDVVSLSARSAKAGSTPQNAAPCHQVCGEMLITSVQ